MVERDALEMRCPLAGTVGSNPTLSANQKKMTPTGFFWLVAGGVDSNPPFDSGSGAAASEGAQRQYQASGGLP